MTCSCFIRLLALGGLGLAASGAAAQELHCWKDDDGRTRCADTVPPDQARFDREVRNVQGVVIRFEEGEITAEERAEIEEQVRREQERLAAEEEAQRYDRMLLDSYLTVGDIEARRDRIMEQFEGDLTVAEIYLGNLGRKLESLNRSVERYAPHNEREGAEPVPQNLALDIQRTRSSIAMFEQRVAEIRADQEATRSGFDKDIVRFLELKGSGN